MIVFSLEQEGIRERGELVRFGATESDPSQRKTN